MYKYLHIVLSILFTVWMPACWVRSARVPTPHNRSQHIQANTTRGFIQTVLLTMGIMMPETCWVNLLWINIYTCVICWFFLLPQTEGVWERDIWGTFRFIRDDWQQYFFLFFLSVSQQHPCGLGDSSLSRVVTQGVEADMDFVPCS